MTKHNKTLVLSVAMNGYQWLYSHFIATHQDYAEQHGYDYQLICRPMLTALGAECCWLKLTLIRDALKAGYGCVVFFDADARVRERTPAVNTILQDHKYVYLCKGYSGRFNSGVMVVRNHPDSQQWLDKIIASRFDALPQEDNVGWGENGHIIHHSHGCDFVEELNLKWNNTYHVDLEDYIRHYNAGPLRVSRWIKLQHRAIGSLCKRYRQIVYKLQALVMNKNVEAELTILHNRVVQHYQLFTKPNDARKTHRD